MMEEAILAAYSSLTIAALLLFILAISILAACVHERSYNGRFTCSLGLALWSGFQFLDRAWWTAWKANYISRDPSQWMIDHWVPLVGPIMMTIGILLVMLYLTKNSPFWRFFWVSLAAVSGSFFLTVIK